MTTLVRIENADTSDHRLKVEVFDVTASGENILVETRALDYPTDMIGLYVFGNRFIKISENGPANYAFGRVMIVKNETV
jgi:hypothetical protein